MGYQRHVITVNLDEFLGFGAFSGLWQNWGSERGPSTRAGCTS